MSQNELGPVVIDMPRTSVTEDGKISEMELLNDDGSKQTIRFSPSTFQTFVSRTFQLFANEKVKRGSASGHTESQPIPVSATMAQEAVGGEKVILSVRMDNGLPVDFSLDAAESEELHRQLGKAVKKARKQSASRRH